MTSGLCEYEGCKRVIYDGKSCICHSSNPNKDIQKFNHELNKIFYNQKKEVFDCNGFIFVDDDPLLHFNADTRLSCVGAKFLGKCRYPRQTWKSAVDFGGSEFLNEVNFADCVFYKGCNFSGCIFSNSQNSVSFTGALFKDMADFIQTDFRGHVDFTRSSFELGCRFTGAKFSGVSMFVKTRFNHVCFMEGGIVFQKQAIFSRATFVCSVNFKEIKFLNGVSFDNTEFESHSEFQGIDFEVSRADSMDAFSGRNAHFKNDLYICGCKFGGNVSLVGLTVDGIANFQDSTFHQLTDFRYGRYAKVSFDAAGLKDHIMFHGVADFRNLIDSNQTHVEFRHIDMRTTRLIEAPIHRFEFIGCRWGDKKEMLETEKFVENTIQSFRERCTSGDSVEAMRSLGLHTEDDIGFAYLEAAQVYRKLQLKYLEYLEPFRSGIFHQREQRFVRKAIQNAIAVNWKYSRFLKVFWNSGMYALHVLYKIVSGYGESIALPFFYLVVLLFAIPFGFLMNGYYLEPEFVDYEFTTSLADFGNGFVDYWRVFTSNLSDIVYRRSELTQRPAVRTIVLFQSILLAITIPFLILAIRRRFKRKSY